MLEKTIENKVKTYAKSLGFLCYKFTSPANRSVPDQVFIYKGRVVFIEFKARLGKLSKLQEYTIDKLRKNKAEVYIINNIEDGVKLIDEIYTKGLPKENH